LDGNGHADVARSRRDEMDPGPLERTSPGVDRYRQSSNELCANIRIGRMARYMT
jgi:hypothetical protein